MFPNVAPPNYSESRVFSQFCKWYATCDHATTDSHRHDFGIPRSTGLIVDIALRRSDATSNVNDASSSLAVQMADR